MHRSPKTWTAFCSLITLAVVIVESGAIVANYFALDWPMSDGVSTMTKVKARGAHIIAIAMACCGILAEIELNILLDYMKFLTSW